jgi:DNA-binding MarR family transcriptional regulator
VASKAELCAEVLASVHAINWMRKRSADAQYGDKANLLATLAVLRECDGVRITDLADRLMTDLSVVSRRVRALRGRGLIKSVPDPADRRAQLVALSPAGAAMLDTLRASTGESIAKAMSGWTVTDLRTLAEMLSRFEADLAQLSSEAEARQS